MWQTWLAGLNDLQATLPARIDAYFTKKVCKKGTIFSDFLKLIRREDYKDLEKQKYKEIKSNGLDVKRKGFTFPTIEKIIAYAEKEFDGVKNKRKWTHGNQRPIVCFCQRTVNVSTTSQLEPHIKTFGYPYLSCHFKQARYANSGAATCVFYVPLLSVK
jgi:hypothetical protein